MHVSIHRLVGHTAVLLGGLLLSISAFAQSFPSKPVTLLVPYPAGGVSGMLAAAQIGFLTRGELPVNNVEEFLEYARQQAQEGGPVTYASVGPGPFEHLLAEQDPMCG